MTPETTARRFSRADVVAAMAAFPIGVVAGVTGVGGGEYRAPVLLLLLRNVRWTIAGNLVAGVIVSIALVVLRGALFQATDTSWAPWFAVRSDDKKRARLNIIKHMLGRIPYKSVPRDKVKLPKRQKEGKYKEIDYPFKFVPEVH